MAVMLLRNSERQTFKKCEHRWQWTYRDGREAREAAMALRFGDLIHRALAPYYKPGKKRGPHPAETFDRLYIEDAKRAEDEGFDVWSDEKWVNARDLGTRMLEGYVCRFAPEEDGRFQVISSEMTFQHLVRVPAGGSHFRFKVVGTFDGLWLDLETGRKFFKEFKTASAIKFDGLPLDEQASTYWTYGPRVLQRRGLLKPDELPTHILYTFLRKAAPDPEQRTDEQGRNLNKDGSVSKRQPAPFFARTPVYRDRGDRERQHARVVQEAARIARARLGPDEANIKNPGPLHMPNCLGCPVRDACEIHETGGDWQPVLDAATKPWNPYAAHELAERS
jgi:PD-(D/E)XK nuclease superfamily